ncbi:hypothetical protein Paride_0198 [Pseudomonas phage Paride]|nr:hypothetical protein Deiofobo_0198 [Pseudomonas phage Deifobo]WPK39908.1 hypothetical protein ETTORE_0199 [Pseudomonas phage Ettore]WPK40428.1 hypothetical protein Paride_0198 [Pseudomonas phage Paride]
MLYKLHYTLIILKLLSYCNIFYYVLFVNCIALLCAYYTKTFKLLQHFFITFCLLLCYCVICANYTHTFI